MKMNENNDNIYKPKATGPILAGLALVLVLAVIVSVVCIIALSPSNNADDPQSSTTTTASTTTTTTTTTTSKEEGTQPVTPPDNPGDNDPETPPVLQATQISVPSDNAYKGPLLLIDGTNFYHVPESDLLTRSEMAQLTASQLLSKYNFKNVYLNTGGNYFVKKSEGYYLNVDTLSALNQMMAAFATESGHKDVQLRNAYYYDPAETPFCMNATGYCIDLEINVDGRIQPLKHELFREEYYNWFINNCAKFGFIHTGDTKSSTNEELYSSFRYVGIAHASYMTDNSMSLETYLDTVKNHTFDNRLVLTGADGNEWWVYYAAGTGESTPIKVIGENYSISGNNYDGFVIAINASALRS